MIETHSIEAQYFVSRIKEHQQYKDAILSAIDEMPDFRLDRKDEHVHKTDFLIDSSFHRKYLDIFYPMIEPYMVEMCKKLQCDNWEIQNSWYQQYKTGDTHGWHNHPLCQFSNIYYLECPDSNMITSLYDLVSKKMIDLVDIKEGDVLTFPSYMLHKSKKINSDKRKSIISFNSSFIAHDDSRIESLVRGLNYD